MRNIDRIKAHMQWHEDLRFGFVPRRDRMKARAKLAAPKERLVAMKLSERAYMLCQFAKGMLASKEHKVTFDELLNWMLNREEERRANGR